MRSWTRPAALAAAAAATVGLAAGIAAPTLLRVVQSAARRAAAVTGTVRSTHLDPGVLVQWRDLDDSLELVFSDDTGESASQHAVVLPTDDVAERHLHTIRRWRASGERLHVNVAYRGGGRGSEHELVSLLVRDARGLELSATPAEST